MKRCPECRRDYYDDTLGFCLDDGTRLVDGPAPGESATAIFPEGGLADESATAILSNPSATVDHAEAATSASSAEYLFGEIKRHKRVVSVAALALLAALGGIGFAVYKLRWPDKQSAPVPFAAMKMTQVTTSGKAMSAVVSPDGKQVVYVIDEGGLRSLWLRQVATTTDVRLRPPEDARYWSLTISPDGDFLYYASTGISLRNRVLFKMPLVGGSPKKIVDDISTPISFSPDGRQFAFARNSDTENALIIANADGTEERKIAARPSGTGSFGNFFQGGTAWSPDGRKILSIARGLETDRGHYNIVEVPVEGGPERPLTSRNFFQIQRLAWLADGSGLLMTAAEQASDFQAAQIWHVSYPDGETRKITNDLKEYQNISLNADSSVLVTIQADKNTDIWVAPGGAAARAAKLTSLSSRMDGASGIAWTPDGKIVFHSLTGTGDGIWIMDGDGANRKQLTAGDTVDFFPSVSADGRFIVFNSERTGRRTFWRMNIDGSSPKQLSETGGGYPQASGEWVLYQTGQGLWKIAIDGGEPVKLGDDLAWAAISLDGKFIACVVQVPSPARLAVIPIEGGELKIFDATPIMPARIQWTPDGRAVTYVDGQNGAFDIWSQPIDGGEPKKLTDFKADAIFSFNWSRDNKLVISHGTSTSDVVLIRNLK
ncbi:MAG: hypothetical protein WKF92_07140 [Pyrinomonadaceae bacterium]